VLALVLVNPFNLDIKERVRIHDDARTFLEEVGESAFVVGLYGLPISLEIDVEGQRLQVLELAFEIGYPSVSDALADEGAQLRVAKCHPAPRRHAVCHIKKFLRGYPVEISEDSLLQKLRV